MALRCYSAFYKHVKEGRPIFRHFHLMLGKPLYIIRSNRLLRNKPIYVLVLTIGNEDSSSDSARDHRTRHEYVEAVSPLVRSFNLIEG